MGTAQPFDTTLTLRMTGLSARLVASKAIASRVRGTPLWPGQPQTTSCFQESEPRN
jgi:hypothetical protein